MSNPFGRQAAFRSALLMTGSTYITYAVGLVVSTLISRGLGPTEYGQYAYLLWLCSTLIVLYNNGLTMSCMRFISECVGRGDAEGARNVHGWLQWRHWASLVIISVLFLLALPWLKPAGWEGHLWLFAITALVGSIPKSGFLFGTSVSKGHGLFNLEAHTTNLMSLISLVGVVILAALKSSLEAYILLFIGLSAGHSIMMHLLMRQRGLHASHGELEAGLMARMKQHLLWSIVLTMLNAFSNKSIETLLLNSLVGPEAVGYFAIAGALTRGGIDLLASGLSSILMPVMAHAFGAGGAERVNRIMSDAVRYYFFLGMLLAGVGFLWATPVVTAMYGSQYAQAAVALQVMVLVGGITMTDGAFAALLSTTDHQRMRAIMAILSVVVSAVTAFGLIPTYGFEGALAAHGLSRALLYTIGMVVMVRGLKVPLPYRELVRILAAAAIGLLLAGLVLIFSRGLLAQFIAGGLYALGYFGGSLLMRVWTDRDVSVVSSLAQRVRPLRGLADWLERHARKTV